jgi:hypothetical protein
MFLIALLRRPVSVLTTILRIPNHQFWFPLRLDFALHDVTWLSVDFLTFIVEGSDFGVWWCFLLGIGFLVLLPSCLVFFAIIVIVVIEITWITFQISELFLVSLPAA